MRYCTDLQNGARSLCFIPGETFDRCLHLIHISIIGRSLALMSAWNSCIVVVAHQKTSSAPRRNAARCAVTGRETNQTTITPWVMKMSILFEQSYHTYELL